MIAQRGAGRLYADGPDGAGHELMFPPHSDGCYTASALCSCGRFQWDSSSAEAVEYARDRVIADWREHVAQAVAARNAWRRP